MIKNMFLILLSVVLLTLATPGFFNLGFFALIAYVPFIYSIKKNKANGFKSGLIFGFLYFIINLFWVSNAVNFFGNVPAIIGYSVLFVFVLYLSLYFAIFGYLCEKKDDIFILSFAFVALEAVKSYAFTGFPWINLGLTQYSQKFSIGWASVVGEFGLSFFIMIINFLVFYSLGKDKKRIVSLILSVCLFYAGGLSISKLSDKKPVKVLNIDIIQTNYNQHDKWKLDKRNELIKYVINLLDKSILSKSEITILPEAAFPVFIEKEKFLFNYLNDLSKIKAILLGSLRTSENKNKKNFYNSAYFFQNEKFYVYDKRHLVPFGEYFPLGNLLKPISYYFFGTADDFSKGYKQKVFKMENGITISTLICYESAYTNLIPYEYGQTADLMAVLTNDSWFNNLSGKKQHLALSVIRAVEYGKPFVRASQSGISACIDANGNILKHLEKGEGILNCNIPVGNKKQTLFSKFQYFWFLLIIGIILYRQGKEKQKK